MPFDPARGQPRVGVLGGLAFLVELVMIALLAVAGWRLGTGTASSLALVVGLWWHRDRRLGALDGTAVREPLDGAAHAAVATALFVGTGVWRASPGLVGGRRRVRGDRRSAVFVATPGRLSRRAAIVRPSG